MLISIITVNYRSQPFLGSLFHSIHRQLMETPSSFTFETILANNETEPLPPDSAWPISPIILNFGKNLGFAAANNQAAKKASGDWLLFLNPDLVIPDSSLLNMFTYFAAWPKIGIIAPKLLLAETGQPQPWTSGKKLTLREIILQRPLEKSWLSPKTISVDWVSGTALLVKKNLYEKLGGFDERFFMYFEDQDLCLRAKKRGAYVIFFPQAKVVHFDGKSWDTRHRQKTAFYQSQDLFFQKHNGSFQARALKILRWPIMLTLKKNP